MAEIIITKWQCDRCGEIHDVKPTQRYPRVTVTRITIEEEWHTQAIVWKDICEDCRKELLPLIEGLKKKRK